MENMSNKIIVIISTNELEKARTGMMYAVNALKQGWMDDVKIVFFGPAQKLINKDEQLQKNLKIYQAEEKKAVVCKHIADRDGSVDDAQALDLDVEYVGKLISDHIKQGYSPMIW